jgi:serine/threonine protein phosphatase PrpC
MNQVGLKTDKGITRSLNEDACGVLPSSNVYLVADGVGGNNAGEVASQAAIEEICQYVQINPIEDVPNGRELEDYLRRCTENANDTVYAIGRKNPENRGLATTLIMCYTRDRHAYFVNVGDSRAYICRKGKLFKVTEDHSYVNSLVKLGVLSRKEAEEHSNGNVITRAVGADRHIQPDIYHVELHEDDVIMLCTDGLYHEVAEDEILEIIMRTEDMSELADKLVDAANIRGGRDNITVVTIKLRGGNE